MTDRPSPSTVTVERHLIDARNTLAKTVTTHLGSVDFMTIPRAAFDSALRNIDAAREASGHTALLREIEVLREAGNGVIERMSSTYRARNGREMGIEGDDGEKCWIVHSDDIECLRAALSRPLDERN